MNVILPAQWVIVESLFSLHLSNREMASHIYKPKHEIYYLLKISSQVQSGATDMPKSNSLDVREHACLVQTASFLYIIFQW